MEKQGVFYAVSVGPGDPELLTRQACRVLTECGVVAAPRMKSGRMLALDIAAGAVDMQGKTILPLDFTMARDAAVPGGQLPHGGCRHRNGAGGRAGRGHGQSGRRIRVRHGVLYSGAHPL